MRIAIVILAAGASSRMGYPKQLLKLGDSSLIRHAISVSQSTSAAGVYVVLGANYEVLVTEIANENVTVIPNVNWQKGLGASIATAAQYMLGCNGHDIDGILYVLADQPLVTSAYLNKMITHFIGVNRAIIASQYRDGKFGVPVLFHRDFLEELSVLHGDEGAKHLLNRYKCGLHTITPDFDNIDVDTPADFKTVSKYFHKQ